MSITAPKFRKKPVTIHAMLLDGTPADLHNVMAWMEQNGSPYLRGDATNPDSLRYPYQDPHDRTRPTTGHYLDPATGMLRIRTLEGDMTASLGDWIIQGVRGEFYPCRPDIFHQTYERTD